MFQKYSLFLSVLLIGSLTITSDAQKVSDNNQAAAAGGGSTSVAVTPKPYSQVCKERNELIFGDMRRMIAMPIRDAADKEIKQRLFKDSHIRRIIANSYSSPCNEDDSKNVIFNEPSFAGSHIVTIDGEYASPITNLGNHITERGFSVNLMLGSLLKPEHIPALRDIATSHEHQKKNLPYLRTQCISKNKGFGIVACQAIPQDTLVRRFTGDVSLAYSEDVVKNSDCYTVSTLIAKNKKGQVANGGQQIILDPRNMTVFFNHSAQPNIEVIGLLTADNIMEHWFVTTEPIAEGEELCWDYGRDYWENRGVKPE